MATGFVLDKEFDLRSLQRTWAAFDRVARLRPIRSEAEYGRSVALMNYLLDLVGDQETHPLAGLLDLVSELVADYESTHLPVEPTEPAEVLRYLLENRGLKQSDLAAIVAQSNLSAILAGRRQISATLAGKLGKFFKISPTAFIAS